MAAIVAGRAFVMDIQVTLASPRYSFPSVLLLCTLWLLIAVRLRLQKPALLYSIALVAGIYTLTSYHIYTERLQHRVNVKVSRYNKGIYHMWTIPKAETKAIVARATTLGVYNPPARPLPNLKIDHRREVSK